MVLEICARSLPPTPPTVGDLDDKVSLHEGAVRATPSHASLRDESKHSREDNDHDADDGQEGFEHVSFSKQEVCAVVLSNEKSTHESPSSGKFGYL